MSHGREQGVGVGLVVDANLSEVLSAVPQKQHLDPV